MMKLAVLLAVLFVGINAKAFPWGQYNYPYNLDTPDDDGQQGQVNVAGQAAGQNEPGDTPDDDDIAPGGGQAAAGQAGTTAPPPAASPGADSSSSSSSSEEDTESVDGADGGAGTTAPPAGPIVGLNPAGTGGTGQDPGDSSGDVAKAVGGPIQAPNAGDTSTLNAADPGGPNPLNMMKPQAVKAQESRRASAGIALTTFLLVAAVASVSVVAYKYKDAISARLGL